MSLRSQIQSKAASALARREVELKELDMTVYVTELSVQSAAEWTRAMAKRAEERDVELDDPSMERDANSDLLIRSLRDEEGDLIFRQDDHALVRSLPLATVRRLVHIALEISGFGEEKDEVGND